MGEFSSDGPGTLNERLSEVSIRSPNLEKDYYALTILGEKSGKNYRSFYSHWVRFDDDQRYEYREPSIIHANRVSARWRNIEERCVVVDDLDDFEIFYLSGGHAVIEQSVAQAAIKPWLEPNLCARDGAAGFVAIESLPKKATSRAPTPRTRMDILKRDDFRCKICGRRATDYVDIELHVHHIRPWGKGGLTLENNLITLCHTCHKGLDPHFEPRLYRVLNASNGEDVVADHVRAYWEGVRLYRKNLFSEELG